MNYKTGDIVKIITEPPCYSNSMAWDKEKDWNSGNKLFKGLVGEVACDSTMMKNAVYIFFNCYNNCYRFYLWKIKKLEKGERFLYRLTGDSGCLEN